ncbi:MAG: hypothetical protein AAF639_32680 [Chloroflexota bacterium]
MVNTALTYETVLEIVTGWTPQTRFDFVQEILNTLAPQKLAPSISQQDVAMQETIVQEGRPAWGTIAGIAHEQYPLS